MPSGYRSRTLSARPIAGLTQRPLPMIKQRSQNGRSEPTVQFSLCSPHTRLVTWSNEPASGVAGLVCPPPTEGRERRCHLGL